MQYEMTSDGAKVSGMIRLTSKHKLLEVKGDYNAVFKVEGTLDKKLEKDIFERYLVNVGKEIAKGWLKYEEKAIKSFTSSMDKAEKALEKMAKSVSQSELKAAVDRQNAQFKKLAEDEFKKQMDGFVGGAHSGALKDKKKLIFKAGKIVVGLVVTVVATVVAAPVGAALIASAVASCLGAAATAGVSCIKIAQEFIGNYKSYNKSLGELDAKIIETIKYARACEAKFDVLSVQKAQIEMQMERIKKEDPGAALTGQNKELKDAQNQLADLMKSIERMTNYSSKDVEKSLTDVRRLVRDLQGEPYQAFGEDAAKKLGTFAKLAALASKRRACDTPQALPSRTRQINGDHVRGRNRHRKFGRQPRLGL
jgi:hypothetical protein